MKRTILLLAFTYQFFLPLKSGAEDQLSSGTAKTDTLAIRLQEAVLMALERNPTVTIQRLTPEIAKTYSREQSAMFNPDLLISASKSETKMQLSKPAPGQN